MRSDRWLQRSLQCPHWLVGARKANISSSSISVVRSCALGFYWAFKFTLQQVSLTQALTISEPLFPLLKPGDKHPTSSILTCKASEPWHTKWKVYLRSIGRRFGVIILCKSRYLLNDVPALVGSLINFIWKQKFERIVQQKIRCLVYFLMFWSLLNTLCYMGSCWSLTENWHFVKIQLVQMLASIRLAQSRASSWAIFMLGLSMVNGTDGWIYNTCLPLEFCRPRVCVRALGPQSLQG